MPLQMNTQKHHKLSFETYLTKMKKIPQDFTLFFAQRFAPCIFVSLCFCCFPSIDVMY